MNIGSLQPGFGYTISKDKLDVDGNNCKDFAIGYPKANRVILLRSKEVVILEDLKGDAKKTSKILLTIATFILEFSHF